jgi:hypothetical protein
MKSNLLLFINPYLGILMIEQLATASTRTGNYATLHCRPVMLALGWIEKENRLRENIIECWSCITLRNTLAHLEG